MRYVVLSLLTAVWLLLGPNSLAPAAETAESLAVRSQAALAQLAGEISLPGLHEPVEVLRDKWGVAHIYAANQDDLFFAQGLVAAQDRLFQMDLWRRKARGEMAEIAGSAALEGDRFARLLKYRGDMQAEWSSYDAEARQIASAFTRGINAYIDHLGDRLPLEFGLLGFRPAHWQPEDCLGRMAGLLMIRNFDDEVVRAQLVAAVGAEKARQLAPTDPVQDYGAAPGLDLAGINSRVLEGYENATKAFDFSRLPSGSNNWVVDGSMSASGKPLLANDPHRSITLPSLRYIVHLNAPGWNVIGGGEPALPGVAIGHNDRIAWGTTLVNTDQSDIFVEETNPDAADQYRSGDTWQKMEVIRERVKIRGQAEPVELELRFTRHGPVIHEDRSRQRVFALKWSGSEPGAAGYLGSLALDRAANHKQFLAAAARWKLPSANLVYADVDGNIGWIAAALTPKRAVGDGLLPVPGAGGEYEWNGFLSVDELPQEFNPAEHFIVTANANILPPGYLYPISYEWAVPFRTERLRAQLEHKPKFDLTDFRRMQYDNTTLPGIRLARLAQGLKFKEPQLEQAAATLARWDGNMSADSTAAPIYAFWWHDLMEQFFQRHLPADAPKELQKFVRSGAGPVVLLAALEKPGKSWFGAHPAASRDLLLRNTFAHAVERLEKLLSPDQATWSWGRLHVVAPRHLLSTLGPEYAKALNLPVMPYGGDSFSPNQSRWNDKFEHTHGGSYRQVLDLADWDDGLATNSPGQSAQPGSPHYGDLLPLWQAGEYFPLAFSRDKVNEVATDRLVLKPR